MTLNDNATLVIGAGNYLLAPIDTAKPSTNATLKAPPTPWANVGHTSIEDILSFESDGGEATVLQTLQNRTLRTVYSSRTETLGFTLQQFDADSLKLYFGSNMVTVDTWLGVPATPTVTTKAFLAVFIDGANVFGLYAPKAEIFRNDDLSFDDTENLAGLPLGVKPLISGSNTWTYALTPLGSV